MGRNPEAVRHVPRVATPEGGMMAPVIALTPALQRFDWGSSQGIPDLLGFAPDGGPYAEAWWGAHPSAPSVTASGPLDEVIAADIVGCLLYTSDAADE